MNRSTISAIPTLLDLVGVPQPKQQQIDGLSYAAVLRETGALKREAFLGAKTALAIAGYRYAYVMRDWGELRQ